MTSINAQVSESTSINAQINPDPKITTKSVTSTDVNVSSLGVNPGSKIIPKSVTLSESKQTMFSNPTFTGKVQLSSYGNTTTPLTFNGGNSTGTTAYTTAFDQNGNIIEDTKYITCRFTNAALVNLYSRPKLLLPSQGANSAIIVKEYEMFLDNSGNTTTGSQGNLAMGFFNNVTIEDGATYESVATGAGGDYPSSFARRLGGSIHAGKFYSSGTIPSSILSAVQQAPNKKLIYHRDVPSDQGIRAYVNRALYFTNPINVGGTSGSNYDKTIAHAFPGEIYLRIGYVVRTESTHFTGLGDSDLQTYNSSLENHI